MKMSLVGSKFAHTPQALSDGISNVAPVPLSTFISEYSLSFALLIWGSKVGGGVLKRVRPTLLSDFGNVKCLTNKKQESQPLNLLMMESAPKLFL